MNGSFVRMLVGSLLCGGIVGQLVQHEAVTPGEGIVMCVVLGIVLAVFEHKTREKE